MSGHARAVRIATESKGQSTGAEQASETQNQQSGLPRDVEVYLESHPPTEEHILTELQSKNLGDGMDTVTERKKALLKNVVDPFESTEEGKNFLALVKDWKPDAAEKLRNAIPASNAVKRSEFNKEKVARCMLNIHDVMLVIDSAIADEHESIVLRTASSKKFWNFVFKENVALWIQIATDLAKNTIASKACSLYVPLDGRQIGRRFKSGGFLWSDDPAERACISCHHSFVDMPNECKNFAAINKSKNEEHQAALREWQVKHDKGERNLGPKPRAPKQLIRQKHCHCGQFHCGGNPTPGPQQCPILCINPITKNRYNLVDNVCQCPICLCDCRLAIKVRDVVRLLFSVLSFSSSCLFFLGRK